MPGVSPQGVFLSYRREDTGPYARSLQLQLSQRIPDATIFMDLDSIEPGLDFAEVIQDAVNSCAVLVALIGPQWATLTDEEGVRRLDNPDDYVRFEVKTALERGVRVIPVLVDGAKPLRQQELPAELHKLARLNADKLSYDRYRDDANRLLDVIQGVLARVGERPEPAEVAHHQGPEEAELRTPVEADRQDRDGAELKAPDEAGSNAQKDADAKAREAGLRAGEERAGSTGEEADAAQAREQDVKPLPVPDAPVVGQRAEAAGSPSAQVSRYQRYCLICLIFCLILCSISMAWINKVPGGTGLSHTLGWLIGLSVAGALLSLALLVLDLNRRGARKVGWAWVPILSLSFLAFAPFLWLAVIRRRARDWAVFAAYLAAVAAEIALASVGVQGSTAWSISYAMIPLVAGTAAVHALVALRPAAGEPVMDAAAPEDWQQDADLGH